jgi:hypothetical protein
MNDQLQQQLLTWASNAIEIAKDEIPAFAQEILNYGFYNRIFEIIFGIILLAQLPFYVRYIRKLMQNDFHNDNEGFTIFISLVSITLTIVGLAYLFDGIITLIKITCAPRLYLLDYILKK